MRASVAAADEADRAEAAAAREALVKTRFK
jgi:hypothetical protein